MPSSLDLKFCFLALFQAQSFHSYLFAQFSSAPALRESPVPAHAWRKDPSTLKKAEILAKRLGYGEPGRCSMHISPREGWVHP